MMDPGDGVRGSIHELHLAVDICKVHHAFAVPDADGDIVLEGINLRGESVLKIIYHDLFFVREYYPVLPDACILILPQLDQDIGYGIARGYDLYHEIRCADDARSCDLGSVAYDQYIRHNHGFIITVELDIGGGNEGDT